MATETLRRFLQGRWFVIAVGVLVMITSAGAYSFGVYSQKLKAVLDINQQQMNVVANFKDLGVNLGIFAGLLYDFSSPGLVLFLGSIEASLGYCLAWLSLTKRITPSLWQMCLFLFIGSNSQPMFNTAVLVQAVKMFPASRGIIISLMKGYIGISGAILIQVFVAIEGSKNPEAFLLLLVWLPSAVAIAAMLVIRKGVPAFQGFPERKWFYWYLALGIALAFYLMGVNIATNLTKVNIAAQRGYGAGLLVLLAVPLIAISWASEFRGKQSAVDDIETTTTTTNEDQQNHGVALKADTDLISVPDEEVVKEKILKKGDDHTIMQALLSLDFWLLFVATVFGVGSGLTATDNMAQLGLSLRYSDTNVRTFVSLLSIWNSIGRWTGGFLSDYLVYRNGFARTKFHTIMLLVMALAYMLLAINLPMSLYYCSILLGLSFGTQYPLYTTIVADVFGLKWFATIYNCLNLSCSVGNYILSGPLAGRFYDNEAKKQARASSSTNVNAKLVCDGPECFRNTCITLMAVSIGAAGFAGLLWYRTRGLYMELHQDYKKAKMIKASHEENDGHAKKNGHEEKNGHVDGDAEKKSSEAGRRRTPDPYGLA